MTPSNIITAGVAATALIGGIALTAAAADDAYETSVVLDSASNLVEDGPVLVNGFEAGQVRSIKVENGKAVVRLSLDDDFAPLHEGARVVMSWKATLSERQLQITDGPEKNAKVPDGGMIPGEQPSPVELDDILAALDEPTRKHVSSLLKNLNQTLEGHEDDAAATVKAAGPALEALGRIAQEVGADEPAIRNLVTRLNQIMAILAQRDDKLRRTVDSLSDLTTEVAGRRNELRDTLNELPPTLQALRGTMHEVDEVSDDAVPLLEDLEPATAKLGPLARDLKPVMQDLRPLAADLRPALASASELLTYTPGLLDRTDDLVPDAEKALTKSATAVDYMRPYTPEMTGYLSTWASAFANWDANGNFARIIGVDGATGVNANPGVVPPGVTNDPYPAPGGIVGQPWTDAYGSEMR